MPYRRECCDRQRDTVRGIVLGAEGDGGEGWQMEEDEKRGAWERQKDGGERKPRGSEPQTERQRAH